MLGGWTGSVSQTIREGPTNDADGPFPAHPQGDTLFASPRRHNSSPYCLDRTRRCSLMRGENRVVVRSLGFGIGSFRPLAGSIRIACDQNLDRERRSVRAPSIFLKNMNPKNSRSFPSALQLNLAAVIDPGREKSGQRSDSKRSTAQLSLRLRLQSDQVPERLKGALNPNRIIPDQPVGSQYPENP